MSIGRTAVVTDTGRKRRRNEDAFVCEPPLFAVADGMGGARAGELASRLAAAALEPGERPAAAGAGEDRVTALIQEANRRVYQRSSEDTAVSGMGTTMTVALVDDGEVSFGHVGDSRAYLVRDGRLDQLTDDHSLVAELMRDGKLSPEEAEMHPQRSVITRVLGTDPDVDVDTFTVRAKPGDAFLLATDGLTSMLADAEILRIFERHRGDLDAAARELVRAANRSGGEDNITVVCFEMQEERAATGSEAEPAGDAGGVDDEDTLDELDGVPALRTAVSPGDTAEDVVPRPYEADRDGRAPRRRPSRARRRRGPLYAALVLVLLAAACVAALFGLSRSHFVGAEGGGRIAVYQGVPFDVVGKVRLYREVYVSRLLAAQLTQPERLRLLDHDLRSKASALAEVRRHEQQIVR